MDRIDNKEFRCYLTNANNNYFYSNYNNLGYPVVSTTTTKTFLEFSPSNLKEMQLEFATNKNYFSGVRSVLINFIFTGDGADILRDIKYAKKGYADEVYFSIERWNYTNDTFEVYYKGRLDLAQTKDTIIGFQVPCIDASCWGILSQNDTVKYSIDCSSHAPNAVPILFDGLNLKSKYTWQPVNSPMNLYNSEGVLFDHPIALVLVNQDGDSTGIVVKSQDYISEESGRSRYDLSNYIYKPAKNNTVRLKGEFRYQAKVAEFSGDVTARLFIRGQTTVAVELGRNSFHINDTYTYQTMTFDVTFPLNPGDVVQVFMEGVSATEHVDNQDWIILPDVTNFYIDTQTKTDAAIVYGRRPVDVLKEVVGRGTNNKFTANSNFLTTNNNIVITCGDALRQAANPNIQTSFQDFFKSYDVEYWLAFRVVSNQLLIEPSINVYDDSFNLLEVGEVSDVEITDAYDYLCNEIELNMNKQDYRHTSGRLEFNALNTFSVNQYNVKNKISLVSPYRKDCFGMEFIRYDYQQQSTEDNAGDTSVFMVDITNQTGTANASVPNYTNVEMNNQPLAPIIYFPRQNDSIGNNKPTIGGVSQPNRTIYIYADGNLDGNTISDANGNWSYTIQTPLSYYQVDVNDGVHLLETTFTDLTGTITSRTITLYDTVTPTGFDNIFNNQNLYDNKPLIRGYLETGVSAALKIDGVTVATLTGDGNGRWRYKVTTALSNAAHTIDIGGVVITVNIFSFVELPLITTYLEGLETVNNLPLVEGVAKAGTVVNLYLDYYPDKPIGTATADANGNWSIQLVPLQKTDGTTLTPIPNGNHIISTSLTIGNVSIVVTGYTLNRPAYSSIVGVLDNTVFNTELTPKHNLLKRMPYWKSIFSQQPNRIIKFETADKNGAFSTTLNGVTIKENDDVILSNYTDEPIFHPLIITATVETPYFFNTIIDGFNKGGLVKMDYKGLDLYCLPIGRMKVEDVTNNVQKWSLLLSAKTPLSTLLLLSTPGINITVMSNSIFRSDYNTLHMVKYNFDAPIEFDEQPELYEDWFMNRNRPWVNHPDYLQKVQQTDVIVDQIISNTVIGTITLRMYDASNGHLVNIYSYIQVTPAPIQAPDIVLEATVDFATVPEGEYFFTMTVAGVPTAISERIVVAPRHYGTILIDAGSKRNKPAALFSTGWRSKLRVEGLVTKWIGAFETVINEDETGNFDNLHAIATRKRTVLFGDGRGIPDYLYLKICNAIIMDDLKIQGVPYIISKDASVEPVDKIAGYPMYYYSVNFDLKDNINGHEFGVRMGDAGALMTDDTNYLDVTAGPDLTLLLTR